MARKIAPCLPWTVRGANHRSISHSISFSSSSITVLLQLLLVFSILNLKVVSATIYLNDSSIIWNYTIASGLSDTTSLDCQNAFAAPITCDDTLLALTEDFANKIHAAAPNLQRTCSADCKSSLQDYTRDLGMACNQPGDSAVQTQGDSVKDIPVYLVGQILEYNYAQACLKDVYGLLCFLSTARFPLYFKPRTSFHGKSITN